MLSSEHTIQRLSETASPSNPLNGEAIVMVGSFAPIHPGHLDALDAAYKVLHEQEQVGSLILVPNSEEYVGDKFDGQNYGWTYQKRVDAITQQTNRLPIPASVDDISGLRARHEQINSHVPVTLQQHLGLSASQLFFVVGSDQLVSMETHLATDTNNAVCVLRPGNLDKITEQLEQDWAKRALEERRLVITERANMVEDISSTAIRKLSIVV